MLARVQKHGIHKTIDTWIAREMVSPRPVHNRRRRTREGPELACVRAPGWEVAHAGGERRINVVPWYRLVGVVSTYS